MVKRVRVALDGPGRRVATIDLDATDGAVIGENLKWPDGSVVTVQSIQTAISGGSGTVVIPPSTIASTLWSLILNIPAFIASLVSLATTGFVVRQNSAGDAVTRTMTGTNGRIEVTDGDGVAGNPVFQLGPFPTVKTSIEAGEDYTIPSGHQMQVFDDFTFDGGDLTLDGELIVDGDDELDWPMVKDNVAVDDFLYVPSDYQVIVVDSFTVNGLMDLQGTLAVL